MATIDQLNNQQNPLTLSETNYDYSINGRAVTGQDRAILLLGQALENIDPDTLINSSYTSPILQDPRTPGAGFLTVGEFAARLETEFGLSPADWPGQTTPYNATQSGQYDFDSVNALLQSLGDHLAADDDTTIPFNFVRPDSYTVLGDETAYDLAHQFGLNGSAVANESDIPQRQQQARELIQNLRSRLTELDSRITGNDPYSPGYVTNIWGDSDSPNRSFRDYLENVFNPALTRLTGDSLEDAVRPFGLNSLYASNGGFTGDSVQALQGAITDYETRGIDNSIGAGRVIDLSATNLTSAPLTSAEREERLNAVLDDFVERLSNFEPEIDANPHDWFSSNWGDELDQPGSGVYNRWNTEPGKPASGNQSFQQYLNNYLNPQLEQLTGSTLEELVLPFGLGSLYDTTLTNDFRSTGNNPHFTLDSRNNLLEALGRYRSTELPNSSHTALLDQLGELEREVTALSTHPFFQPNHHEYKGENGTLNQGGLRASLRDVVTIEYGGSNPSTGDYLRQVNDNLRSLTGQTLAELLPDQASLLSQANLSQADLQEIARGVRVALFDAQTPTERNREALPALADAAYRLQRYREHPFLVQFEAGERSEAPGGGFVSSIYADEYGNNRNLDTFLREDVDPILLAQTGRTFHQLTTEAGYNFSGRYSFEKIDRTLEAITTFVEDNYALRIDFASDEFSTLVSSTLNTGNQLGRASTVIDSVISENAVTAENTVVTTTLSIIDSTETALSQLEQDWASIQSQIPALTGTETFNTVVSNGRTVIETLANAVSPSDLANQLTTLSANLQGSISSVRGAATDAALVNGVRNLVTSSNTEVSSLQSALNRVSDPAIRNRLWNSLDAISDGLRRINNQTSDFVAGRGIFDNNFIDRLPPDSPIRALPETQLVEAIFDVYRPFGDWGAITTRFGTPQAPTDLTLSLPDPYRSLVDDLVNANPDRYTAGSELYNAASPTIVTTFRAVINTNAEYVAQTLAELGLTDEANTANSLLAHVNHITTAPEIDESLDAVERGLNRITSTSDRTNNFIDGQGIFRNDFIDLLPYNDPLRTNPEVRAYNAWRTLREVYDSGAELSARTTALFGTAENPSELASALPEQYQSAVQNLVNAAGHDAQREAARGLFRALLPSAIQHFRSVLDNNANAVQSSLSALGVSAAANAANTLQSGIAAVTDTPELSGARATLTALTSGLDTLSDNSAAFLNETGTLPADLLANLSALSQELAFVPNTIGELSGSHTAEGLASEIANLNAVLTTLSALPGQTPLDTNALNLTDTAAGITGDIETLRTLYTDADELARWDDPNAQFVLPNLSASSEAINNAISVIQAARDDLAAGESTDALDTLLADLNALREGIATARNDNIEPIQNIISAAQSREVISPNEEWAALDDVVTGPIAGDHPTFAEYVTELRTRLSDVGVNLDEELAERDITLDLSSDLTPTQLQNASAALAELSSNLQTEVLNSLVASAQAVVEIEPETAEYITAVAGNITRGENGAFYVDGEQRSVIRIAAEIRLQSIDDEATRSAELLQALNERVEKSALGTEILDLLATLPTDGGDYQTQASLWARGDVDNDTQTSFADGLRALAEEYNIDDPFAAFLPNYTLSDTTEYSNDDLVALTNAIGAFQDTATRDNERDNLAIQESHTKLNVLLENLNAIIGLISKLSELIRNIG